MKIIKATILGNLSSLACLSLIPRSVARAGSVIREAGNNLGIEGNYLDIIKVICELTVNIICNGEKLKAFSLRSGTRNVYHFYYFYYIILKFQAREIIWKKIQIEKEDVKLFLFAYKIT